MLPSYTLKSLTFGTFCIKKCTKGPPGPLPLEDPIIGLRSVLAMVCPALANPGFTPAFSTLILLVSVTQHKEHLAFKNAAPTMPKRSLWRRGINWSNCRKVGYLTKIENNIKITVYWQHL